MEDRIGLDRALILDVGQAEPAAILRGETKEYE
jgi:hypothetical protein